MKLKRILFLIEKKNIFIIGEIQYFLSFTGLSKQYHGKGKCKYDLEFKLL